MVTGFAFFLLGGALAERWSRELPDHHAVAEVTGGSVENLNLLLRGEVEVAFSMGTTAYQAYHGTGPFADGDTGRVLALAALYPNALHLVVLGDSEVRDLADLRGRRVSVGAPGSGTEVAARTLLEANGITYEDLRAQRLNFNETANALRDGHVEAGFWSVGPPTSSLVDLATARDVRLVPIGRVEAERTAARDPTIRLFTIPAGTYPGQETAVETVSTPNVLVVRRDFPEELAFALSRSVFEGAEALAGVHPVARSITPDFTLSDAPVRLHPGTVRYLEEAGWRVPDRLLPDG
jgi:TRAP transporter TAXI family solute receptor